MKFETISEFNYPQVAKIYSEGINTGFATFETKVLNWETWDASHLPFARPCITGKTQVLGWGRH